MQITFVWGKRDLRVLFSMVATAAALAGIVRQRRDVQERNMPSESNKQIHLRNEVNTTKNQYSKSNLTQKAVNVDLRKVGFQASCFEPNSRNMDLLFKQFSGNSILPKPVINLGMPKVGSTSLFDFFRCSGWKSSHWRTEKHPEIGRCMREAVKANKPLLKSCDSWYYKPYYPHERRPNRTQDQGTEAFLQMDYVGKHGECIFPQIEFLDEIHRESPNATFILMFRPVEDWARSAVNWAPKALGSMGARVSLCDIPGLPAGKGNSTDDMRSWWCWHVNHVRSFVDRHPSHALIELNLYDTNFNAKIMSSLFGAQEACWGVSNVNKNIVRSNTDNENGTLPAQSSPK